MTRSIATPQNNTLHGRCAGRYKTILIEKLSTAKRLTEHNVHRNVV